MARVTTWVPLTNAVPNSDYSYFNRVQQSNVVQDTEIG